jgi:hypothetical protein
MHNNGQHCWVSCIYYILKELDMLKMLKSPLTCGAREINILELCICPFQFQVYVHLFESMLGLIDLIILLYYLSIFPVGI